MAHQAELDKERQHIAAKINLLFLIRRAVTRHG
jgi:hypothetical protein